MESIQDVREALSARAETRSLDDLGRGGRQRVRVIRAEHVGEMIDAAVQRAVAESGLISREEADRLVARSREEFASVHAERQRDAEELVRTRRDLQESDRRREALTRQLESVEEDLASVEQERDDVRTRATLAEGAKTAAEERIAELEAALAEARSSVAALEAAAPATSTAPVAPQVAAAEPESVEPAAPSQGGANPDALTQALERLTSSMNDRLEKMGRKMGISSAVEADQSNLDGLFANLDEQSVESNLDSVEVKQRQAGGIAANLARLKKLKGGG
jgi:DNA repair exonuclease SbcCD ATPase subunit